MTEWFCNGTLCSGDTAQEAAEALAIHLYSVGDHAAFRTDPEAGVKRLDVDVQSAAARGAGATEVQRLRVRVRTTLAGQVTEAAPSPADVFLRVLDPTAKQAEALAGELRNALVPALDAIYCGKPDEAETGILRVLAIARAATTRARQPDTEPATATTAPVAPPAAQGPKLCPGAGLEVELRKLPTRLVDCPACGRQNLGGVSVCLGADTATVPPHRPAKLRPEQIPPARFGEEWETVSDAAKILDRQRGGR